MDKEENGKASRHSSSSCSLALRQRKWVPPHLTATKKLTAPVLATGSSGGSKMWILIANWKLNLTELTSATRSASATTAYGGDSPCSIRSSILLLSIETHTISNYQQRQRWNRNEREIPYPGTRLLLPLLFDESLPPSYILHLHFSNSVMLQDFFLVSMHSSKVARVPINCLEESARMNGWWDEGLTIWRKMRENLRVFFAEEKKERLFHC